MELAFSLWLLSLVSDQMLLSRFPLLMGNVIVSSSSLLAWGLLQPPQKTVTNEGDWRRYSSRKRKKRKRERRGKKKME
jgi:hypothetical protein